MSDNNYKITQQECSESAWLLIESAQRIFKDKIEFLEKKKSYIMDKSSNEFFAISCELLTMQLWYEQAERFSEIYEDQI